MLLLNRENYDLHTINNVTISAALNTIRTDPRQLLRRITISTLDNRASKTDKNNIRFLGILHRNFSNNFLRMFIRCLRIQRKRDYSLTYYNRNLGNYCTVYFTTTGITLNTKVTTVATLDATTINIKALRSIITIKMLQGGHLGNFIRINRFTKTKSTRGLLTLNIVHSSLTFLGLRILTRDNLRRISQGDRLINSMLQTDRITTSLLNMRLLFGNLRLTINFIRLDLVTLTSLDLRTLSLANVRRFFDVRVKSDLRHLTNYD